MDSIITETILAAKSREHSSFFLDPVINREREKKELGNGSTDLEGRGCTSRLTS